MVNQKTLNLNEVISRYVDLIDTGNNSKRNNEIAKRYFGFDGKGGSSMQVAGEPYSLTRESVRQITNKVAQKLRDTFVVPKELYLAASIVDSKTPASSSLLETVLVDEGIISENYMLEGILSIIDIMDMKDLKIKSGIAIKHNGCRFIVGKENINLAQEIESIAITLISHNGATSIEEIGKEIKGLSKKIKLDFVKDVANSISETLWLDVESDWFYFSERGRNRFFRRLEQIFSVYSKVNVSDLQKAIKRSWKKNFDENKTRLLSKKVMLDLVSSSPDYEVSGNVIACNKDFSAEKHVKHFDLIIFNEIKATENHEIREKILEDAVVSDVNDKWSFSVALNYSPLIIQPEKDGKKKRGCYKLLGEVK
ncbi:hypothetical protein [Psychromonas sp. SP041]|uniref:hypothetical protein n=1 Tax=Psychromonas sp. SP041 TaxID=1365007 RepID=UPI0010C7A940|nr:hypothetical protein [Psychromonas sp. SP041]